jgi:Na+-driven multidrug efflux pump
MRQCLLYFTLRFIVIRQFAKNEMQILVLFIIFFSIAVSLSAVASGAKKRESRIVIGSVGMAILSGIVGSVTYPLGGYSLRIKAS